jgi:hypothetical protein
MVDTPLWTFRAYQGPLECIEATRSALYAALEDGSLSRHQIDLINPPLDQPPAPPAVMIEGEAVFGFAIAAGVDLPAPQNCRAINPRFAGMVLGISGPQNEAAGEEETEASGEALVDSDSVDNDSVDNDSVDNDSVEDGPLEGEDEVTEED